MFSTSVFRPDINVAATSWSWCCFPHEILKVFQYHYNFLFLKIYNIALPLQFLINKIYSTCVNAKRLLKWSIFENFQLVAWIEKRDFWSCVVNNENYCYIFFYNNDNYQDELIINYNLHKIIVYESCAAYGKVFPLVPHF